MNLNFNDFKDDLNTVETPSDAALVSIEETENLITGIMSACKMNRASAATAIAIICQKGGTSKRAQGTIYAVVNGIKLDLATIRRVMQEMKAKFTLRQWARTNGKFIFDVALTFDLPGDLAKKIGRINESLTDEELIWMSNFQMDNPDCPSNVRELLKDHYNSLFPNKNKKI